ncbi:precorrin-2 C(20)-methyltransferase [Brevibacillus ginsengisoli]|uniref:precorrin-2 C(20)-methyltransferase n=1 Tax=Brevibacillus ginsengisoli TaxID=363854 RepID=UPI003CF9AA55
MTGTLHGLGVGPGDPELITVKAFRVLKESAVIAYPVKKRGNKSYAQQIIDVYVNPLEKEMLGLVFPMTKDAQELEREWANAVERIWEKLREGKDVAFVTEGDPLFFSTFIYLMRLMKEQHPEVPIKIVPGITSFGGAASRLALPLADNNDRIAIVPATDDVEEMKKVIQEHDCIVFIKVAKVIKQMLTILRELDLIDKASVVSKVTSPEEIIWDVNSLDDVDLEYLSLMVVRK